MPLYVSSTVVLIIRRLNCIIQHVLLTVHLSIILVINQLIAKKSCFIISLLYASTCFEHCCAHHQEVKLYYTACFADRASQYNPSN